MFQRIFLASILLFCTLNVDAQGNRVQSLYERLQSDPRPPARLENLPNTEQRFLSETWHIGFVLLTDGSKVEGFIKFDMSNDVIQIDSNETIQTYAASQLQKFEILIVHKEEWKVFYALPLLNKNGYYRPALFELAVEGSTSLLFRDKIVLSTHVRSNSRNRTRWDQRTNNPNGPNGDTYYTKSRSREMFLLSDNGMVKKLTTKRREVIQTFDGNHEELKRIIRRNRLNMRYSAHVKTLVEAYNELAGF